MIGSLRIRALLVITAFTVVFTVISSRLIYLQLVKHEHYLKKAASRYHTEVKVPRRGKILDANKRILAQTISVTDLRIDGKLALEETSQDKLNRINYLLGLSRGEIKNKILERYSKPGWRDIELAKGIDKTTEQALRELKVRCLIFRERLQRVYPNGNEGSHVTGFVNRVEKKLERSQKSYNIEVGVTGIEQVANKLLTGHLGERIVIKDGRRAEIAAFRKLDRSPVDGLDVVLTIDEGVQHIIDGEMRRLVEEYDPTSAHIIALRPSTGEVLGISNYPAFDPNNRRTTTPDRIKNRALMDSFEPGSIMKILTLAAVLEEGVADLDMLINCENGKWEYANTLLEDTSPHGFLTVREAFAVSSNIAFAKLATLLGEKKLYHYIKQFGLGDRCQNSSFALRGEARGLLAPPRRWSEPSITRIPIGYEIAVTNLQMAMAVGAIANEGKLMEPRIIKEIINGEGKVVKQYLPKAVRQVVSQKTAQAVSDAMFQVVHSEEGTGKKAAIEGFTAGGKTGTARKVINGMYSRTKFYSSFIGFVPANNPEFLISVIVDDPKSKKYYGGHVAAPAFGNIATQVVHQLHLKSGSNSQIMAGMKRKREGN